MFKPINKSEAAANKSRAMETETIKNGAIPKSLTSRGNQFKVFAVVFICSLFALSTLNSCDKTKKFDGTTWEGDGEKIINAYGSKYTYKGPITISFSSGGNADIKASLKDSKDGDKVNCKGSATYTYDGKNMSIRVKWKSLTAEQFDEEDLLKKFDEETWNGTVDKTTMTLKNVFEENVTFSKQ